MSARWCAFTGALMLGFVLVTFLHKAVMQDAPGVTTRWWDGTLNTVDKHHANGQVASRTVYGDDGKTVLAYQEWTIDGALVRQKIRQKDGRVEEKRFSVDGKVLLNYALWNGDERSFVIKREYHDNGKLSSEVIMTEDGQHAQHRRTFSSDGSLEEEYKILSNADQETISYLNGKPARRFVFKANGDTETTAYYPSGAIRMSERTIRLTGAREVKCFSEDGRLLTDPMDPDEGE